MGMGPDYFDDHNLNTASDSVRSGFDTISGWGNTLAGWGDSAIDQANVWIDDANAAIETAGDLPQNIENTVNEWGQNIEDRFNEWGENLEQGLAGPGASASDAAGAAILSSQRPYLENIYGEGRRLYESGAGKIPSWISDQWRGIAGDQNPFNKTASGAYLNSNPYLDAMYNRAADAVTGQYKNATIPGIRSNFGMAGGYNRGSEGEAIARANSEFGRNLTGLATDIYGGNYATERGRQEDAIRAGFGATGTALGQMTDFAGNDFSRLGQYAGVVGSPFGAGVGQPQQRGNPLMSAVGGALSGGAMGGPWGAIAGGLLGYASAR